MRKSFILLLILVLIFSNLLSCGHKTVDPIDDQTSSSPSEDTSADSTENVIDDSTESNETNQSENTETDDRLTEITEETSFVFVPENYGYTIEKIGDDYYIKFLAEPTISSTGVLSYPQMTLHDFYRVLHLQEPISNTNLYHIYYSFEKDDIGYKIIDIDNLYYPILLEEMTFTHPDKPITWLQYYYYFQITYDGALSFRENDGYVYILTRYEDYMERYNSEQYSNVTVLAEGDKEARITASYVEDGEESYYLYNVLIKSGNLYMEIHLATHELFDDNSIFLEFDFEKYP